MQANILTLYELNQMVRMAIETGLPDSLLVTAEIASLRPDQKGHCYLELVERRDEAVVAQMRATMWASVHRAISRRFQSVTGVPLARGQKILATVTVTFHERYGLSLNIDDIDPSYTLGEMALRRREVLARLEKEGLIALNRAVEFPVLPLRIAVISSPKAAGYEDFLAHLQQSRYAGSFSVELFRATMQGDRAERSVVEAFTRCRDGHGRFDLAVIIRGGGGVADLHCFDSYEIGRAIARFPLPVIAGIGHERDRTVADEVSHTSVKTPTAAAGLIVETVREFAQRVDDLLGRLAGSYHVLAGDRMTGLHRLSRDLDRRLQTFISREEGRLGLSARAIRDAARIPAEQGRRLDRYEGSLAAMMRMRMREERRGLAHGQVLIRTHLRSRLAGERLRLDDRAGMLRHLDPRSVLKRGYSITYHNDRVAKDIRKITVDDQIRTVLYEGTIFSRVTKAGTDDEKDETADL